jgi:hypothetical protein
VERRAPSLYSCAFEHAGRNLAGIPNSLGAMGLIQGSHLHCDAAQTVMRLPHVDPLFRG